VNQHRWATANSNSDVSRLFKPEADFRATPKGKEKYVKPAKYYELNGKWQDVSFRFTVQNKNKL
jgi:hypothetical protein